MQSEKPHLNVRPQRRVYLTITGVVAGMLAVGLAVPLAFGHGSGTSSPSGLPSLAVPTLTPDGSPTTVPSRTASPPPSPGVPTAGPSATAGSGGTTGGGSGGSIGATSGAVRLTASDQGVTATTVKLGVVLLDIQALQPLGFAVPHYSPQEQQQQYQAFIDDVNNHGGLLGRRIVPDYKTFNALDTNGQNSAGAVCRQLAQDDKVFATVGVLGSGIADCLSTQYRIPSITDGSEVAESYQKSNHLIISPLASLERGAANWGDMALRACLLTGHKTGTVSRDAPAEGRPEEALAQALKADGQPVTYRARLSNDQSTAASQLPIEVGKMKAAGVDTVFLSINFISARQWVQAAEQQSFRPRYMVSDVGALTAEGLVRNMGQSFDGAYAFTGHSAVLPEGAEDATCRTTFNLLAHQSYPAGEESAGLRSFCGMIKEFAAGARAAGANLTRSSFAAAVQTLGAIELPNVVRGSFGPQKTDYDDWQRSMKWSFACKCYQNAGAPQQGRY